MPPRAAHTWAFKPRFRRDAFGWRSKPAIQRVAEAVREIQAVARRDPLLGAEGAVLFLERVSPALARVDSSSGAIGAAVNRAIEALAAVLAAAPADAPTRLAWLERLHTALLADRAPYIEHLGVRWGDVCATPEIASAWAVRSIDTVRAALHPPAGPPAFHSSTIPCLSALHRAGRFDELLALLAGQDFWLYRRWAVKALTALGRVDEAIATAEAARGPWAPDSDVDALCEEALRAAGRVDEAYARYGLRAQHGTYVATFRAVAARYPHLPKERVLADLVRTTPGAEGKWFAAAKSLGLLDSALALARTSPCDPRTLARAARDHVRKAPAFALEIGLVALEEMVRGAAYDVTSTDVALAWSSARAAAEALGRVAEAEERLRAIVAAGGWGARFVADSLPSQFDPR